MNDWFEPTGRYVLGAKHRLRSVGYFRSVHRATTYKLFGQQEEAPHPHCGARAAEPAKVFSGSELLDFDFSAYIPCARCYQDLPSWAPVTLDKLRADAANPHLPPSGYEQDVSTPR